jgi:hypothetical protein
MSHAIHLRRLIICLALVGLPLRAAETAEPVEALLKRQTQELLDAVAPGRVEVWDRLLHPDVIYVTESGQVLRKAALLGELAPMPVGMSGTLRVEQFTLVEHGDTAVATHEDHEVQDYFGQILRSRYRSTDTWRRTDAGWRLVAAQLLAIPDDPPAVAFSEQQLHDYVGEFQAGPQLRYAIRRDGDRLFGKRAGRDEQELRLEAPDVLFIPGQPRSRKIMTRNANGQVTGFADRREGHDIVWTRVPPAQGERDRHDRRDRRDRRVRADRAPGKFVILDDDFFRRPHPPPPSRPAWAGAPY